LVAFFTAAFCSLAIAQSGVEESTPSALAAPDAQPLPVAWEPIVVPDTSKPEELNDFIVELSERRPSLREHYIEMQSSIKAAAEKALASMSNRSTPLGQELEGWLIRSSVLLMGSAGVDARRTAMDQLIAYLRNKEKPSIEDLKVALLAGQNLEQLDELAVTKKAYEELVSVMETKRGEEYAPWTEMLKGSLQRINSVGTVVEFKAKTLPGSDFDLQSLRGKFVLLYFWATWDRISEADIPVLEQFYKTYHNAGFEIVSISLDTDRAAIESSIAARKIPWVVLWNEGDDWQQQVVSQFGLTAIPTSTLLDREGKVIHLEARGVVLEKLLKDNLSNDSPPKSPKGVKISQ
jgi:thiol-disulfide isomerase/thioredoxin